MTPSVIIVGAGPVGLTLANLLGLYGVQTLVLETDLVPPDAPRAVSLDDESLRVWQQCGLLDEMRPFIAEGGEGDVVFTYRTRTGKPLFEMTQRGRPYGYARGNVFLFHRVLDVLRAGLKRFPHVELRCGWSAQECKQGRDGVRLVAADQQGERHELTASYLVGCDGGRSTIRNELKIPMQGAAYAEAWLIVDTFDPLLSGRPLQEGVEVWCDQRGPTATIPLPGGYRRWEFLLRGDLVQAETFDDKRIQALIEQRKPPAGARIVRRLVHTYKASVAEHYGRDRIFLAGDAAHLSPPFAGQGMATGLRDAANLGWKLAYVLGGLAPADLLAGYEQERRPHQLRMLNLARRMGNMMMPRSRLHEVLVTLLFGVAGRFAWLRKAMEIRGANITPIYKQPGAAGGRRVGHCLIQPAIGKDGLLDNLLGLHYAVLSFDRSPQEFLTTQELAALKSRGARFLQIQNEGKMAEVYQAFDEWLGGCRGRLLIVRPDRFVEDDRSVNVMK